MRSTFVINFSCVSMNCLVQSERFPLDRFFSSPDSCMYNESHWGRGGVNISLKLLMIQFERYLFYSLNPCICQNLYMHLGMRQTQTFASKYIRLYVTCTTYYCLSRAIMVCIRRVWDDTSVLDNCSSDETFTVFFTVMI